jgi:hypothetical protein
LKKPTPRRLSRLCGEAAQDKARVETIYENVVARADGLRAAIHALNETKQDARRRPMMTSRNRQKRSEARQEKRLARKPKPSKKPRPASFAPANVGKPASEAVEPEGKAREGGKSVATRQP